MTNFETTASPTTPPPPPQMSSSPKGEASGILSTPDPIVMPDMLTVPVLRLLCVERQLKCPPRPTATILINLIGSYNAQVEGGGDYNLKKMLRLSMATHGQRRGLRGCVRATVSGIRRAFLSEQRAAVTSAGVPATAAEAARTPPSQEVNESAPVASPVVDIELARLDFEREKHRDAIALSHKRLDFDQERWRASCVPQPAAPPPPPSAPSPPSPSPLLPPPFPLIAPPTARTLFPPGPPSLPTASQAIDVPLDATPPPSPPLYPQAVPSVAVQPPLSGPLLTVLQDIVRLAHAEPSCRGMFSGMAALSASLAVTPRGTPLAQTLTNLRRGHSEYLRMLSGVEGELGGDQSAALRLPLKASRKGSFSFSDKQRRMLEEAFASIDPRTVVTANATKPFNGATFSTLRAALQRLKPARRRGVAAREMSSPLHTGRASACAARWKTIYKTPVLGRGRGR